MSLSNSKTGFDSAVDQTRSIASIRSRWGSVFSIGGSPRAIRSSSVATSTAEIERIIVEMGPVESADANASNPAGDGSAAAAASSSPPRKRLFKIVIRMVFTYWALYFLFTRYGDVFSSLGRSLDAARNNGAGNGLEDVPPPVFEPPRETAWISYLVGVAFILLVAFLAWRLLRFWRKYPGSSSLEEIGRIARSSLRDLTSGRESTDVIMNCYFRMSDVVADKRNLKRGTAMTPAEFAIRLEQAGLPGDAVRRLTRLFEGVRYGDHRSGPKEVNEAVACLTTILHSCGETI